MNRIGAKAVVLSLLFLCGAVFYCGNGVAGDWPQILGPHRNGIAVDEKIADSWPTDGPKVAWQHTVGEGFSGVAVADGLAVLFHRVGDSEVVTAFNARTGKPRWSAKHPTRFTTAFSSDKGPRCVPLIHKKHVYVFGSQGVLRCLRMKNGSEVWLRNTHKDFGAPEGYFGAGSTPIIEEDKILVNVGSRNKAGIVAFDLATGKTLWKATSEYASYSSPVATTVKGKRHVLFITRMKLVSLDPATGQERFSFAFGKRGPTVNAASPVIIDGHLFATAHYRVGAVYAKIAAHKADPVWTSDDVLSSHYMTPLLDNGLLYGIHGQERVNRPELRCIDPATKKVRWTKTGLGYGSMIKADGKFLLLTTTGELILIKPDAKQYRELARASVLKSTTRALPALSHGLLYIRDTDTLKCLDLRKP